MKQEKFIIVNKEYNKQTIWSRTEYQQVGSSSINHLSICNFIAPSATHYRRLKQGGLIK